MNRTGGVESVEMDRNYFGNILGVTSGEHPGDWQCVFLGPSEHIFVAGLQVLDPEIEWTVRILTKGVCSRLVEEKVGNFTLYEPLQFPFQAAEEFFNVAASGQGR